MGIVMALQTPTGQLEPLNKYASNGLHPDHALLWANAGAYYTLLHKTKVTEKSLFTLMEEVWAYSDTSLSVTL